MSVIRAVASAVEAVLALACWLTPGPRCQRTLRAILGIAAATGALGAALYGLGLL